MSRPAPRGRVNVLHLLPTLGAGGVERLFAWMSGLWSRERFRVIAGLLYRGDMSYAPELADAGVELLQLGQHRRGRVDPRLMPALLRTLRERNIHIVHTHNVSAQVYAQACRLAGYTQLLVFHQHKSPTPLQRWVERMGTLAPAPDLRIAVSESARQELIALGIPAAAIEVVTNGIPVLPGVRTPAPIDPSRPRIVTVTRLSEEKGVESLIRAMPIVRQTAPGARLQIVGQGPLAPALAELTMALGLGDAVEFAGFRPNPRPLLDASDLFVLPSLQEGFGLALVEAMQAGLPCVATRAGGIPEIVEDGVNGLLVTPGDPGAIADAVLRLARLPQVSCAIADNAWRTARRFDIARTVASIESAYERLLARCA